MCSPALPVNLVRALASRPSHRREVMGLFVWSVLRVAHAPVIPRRESVGAYFFSVAITDSDTTTYSPLVRSITQSPAAALTIPFGVPTLRGVIALVATSCNFTLLLGAFGFLGVVFLAVFFRAFFLAFFFAAFGPMTSSFCFLD
jgi:hypothetical protein